MAKKKKLIKEAIPPSYGKRSAEAQKELHKGPVPGAPKPHPAPRKPHPSEFDEYSGKMHQRLSRRRRPRHRPMQGTQEEATNNKFDTRLEEIYKSLMVEADTDTEGETLETRAGAVATAHKRKPLARKAMDALTGNPDGDISDKYDELQKLKKSKLIPELDAEIEAMTAMSTKK